MAEVDSEQLEKLKTLLHERVDEFADYAYPIFLQNGWTYYDGQPDRDRLKQVARQQIDALGTGNRSHATSGRIEAYYHVYHGQARAGLRIARTDDDVTLEL